VGEFQSPPFEGQKFYVLVLFIKKQPLFAAAYRHIYIEFPKEGRQKGLRKALFFVLSKVMLLSFKLLSRPGHHRGCGPRCFFEPMGKTPGNPNTNFLECFSL